MNKKNYPTPVARIIKLNMEDAILGASGVSLHLNEEEADVWSTEREYNNDCFDEE